jgi:very-short-patch-repair endonuclease
LALVLVEWAVHAGDMRILVSRACEDLLERQSGVIARHQATQAGLSMGAIDNLLRAGRWQRLHQGVYATFSGQPSRDARLWAGVLRAGPDAMLSHHTAAGLFGLIQPVDGPMHVTVPSDRRLRRLPGMIIHRADRPRTARHPVLLPPRTRIEETVLDLITTADSADDAFGWVFRATGRGLTNAERIRRAMAARQRMPWRPELTACLDDAEAGVRSNLEHRYVLAVERPHGLPRAERQARVVRAGRAAYLDNLYRQYRAGVELDGRAAHPVGERWRDYRRDNAGATDGIITLRYGWSDVTGQPCQVAAQVAAVLTQRGWSGPARRCGSGCALPRDRGP